MARTVELAVAAAALGAFALLTRRVAASPNGDAFRVDAAVRAWAEPGFHPVGRRVAHVVSLPGYPGAYMPAALLGGWLLRGRGLASWWALPLAALLGWLAHRGVKLVLRRTRPPTPVARGKTEPAFPSGHTTGTTAVVLAAAVLCARAGVASAPAAVGYAAGVALLVGLSRIYLDEHWTTDVLGGLAAGTAAAMLAVAIAG